MANNGDFLVGKVDASRFIRKATANEKHMNAIINRIFCKQFILQMNEWTKLWLMFTKQTIFSGPNSMNNIGSVHVPVEFSES